MASAHLHYSSWSNHKTLHKANGKKRSARKKAGALYAKIRKIKQS